MNNRIVIIILILFNIHIITAVDNNRVKIGISQTYVKTENTYTMFIARNLIFDLVGRNSEDQYFEFAVQLEDIEKPHSDYEKSIFDESLHNGYDYAFVSTAYSSNEFLFLRIGVINPLTREVVYQSLYTVQTGINIYSEMDRISQEIIQGILLLNLQKVQRRFAPQNVINNETLTSFDEEMRTKHELFFQNGFLKVNSEVLSFTSIYTGYGFNPYDFMSLEVGLGLGGGYGTPAYDPENFRFDSFFVSIFHGLHVFIPGDYQPSIGLKAEFVYVAGDRFYFSLPIDLGIKIFVSGRNIIKINSSIQFTVLDLQDAVWINRITLGIMVGYARKI